jgi:hypothetical protein
MSSLIQPPTIMIDKSIVEDVAKLHIENGDIMLVRCPQGTKDEEAQLIVKSFRRWTQECGFPGIRILCVLGDTQVSQLDEARMLSYGWVRDKGYTKCQ